MKIINFITLTIGIIAAIDVSVAGRHNEYKNYVQNEEENHQDHPLVNTYIVTIPTYNGGASLSFLGASKLIQYCKCL